jgi:hypothetical protein
MKRILMFLFILPFFAFAQDEENTIVVTEDVNECVQEIYDKPDAIKLLMTTIMSDQSKRQELYSELRSDPEFNQMMRQMQTEVRDGRMHQDMHQNPHMNQNPEVIQEPDINTTPDAETPTDTHPEINQEPDINNTPDTQTPDTQDPDVNETPETHSPDINTTPETPNPDLETTPETQSPDQNEGNAEDPETDNE